MSRARRAGDLNGYATLCIVRIAVWHALPSGGGKRALFDHVVGLVALGHHVEVWCPPEADEEFLPLRKFARVNIGPTSMVRHPEARWRNRVSQVVHDQDLRLRALDEHCQHVAHQINKRDFDVVFANTAAYAHAPSIGRYVNAPSVLYLQEPARVLYESTGGEHPFAVQSRPRRSALSLGSWMDFARWTYTTRQKALRIGHEIENANSYDRLAVNSYYSRESVLRAYGVNACVCYLGVDARRFRPIGLTRERFLITVGGGRAKNIGFLLDGLADLPTGSRPPKLVWVTNVDDPFWFSELTAQSRDLGIALDVRCRVSEAELLELLNRAYAMVYAPRLEPFGLALLEAAACELPVVAVAEAGVREVIIDRETGLLTGGNKSEFAAAVQELLDKPQLARTLGAKARSNVEARWTLRKAAERLDALLQDAIA